MTLSLRNTLTLAAVAALALSAPPARSDSSDEALFKKLDITEDGWLDGKELEGGWKRFDTDGDGEVTKAEFLAGRSKERGSVSSAEEDKKLFQKLDVTGNGYLTGSELDSANARSFDANGDRVVTLEEFLAGRAGEKARSGGSPAIAPTKAPAEPALKQPVPPQKIAPKPALPVKVAQPVAATMTGGRPVGLFFMTRFWPATGSLEKKVWYFAPDGKAYEGLETGFSPADLAGHKGRKGTYSVGGGSMQVAWSDGKSTRSKVEAGDTGFFWDGGIFTPIKPFANGKEIAGTYQGGESISVGGDRAAVTKTLKLMTDGKFTWDGVGFVQTTTSDSRFSGGAEGTTHGTWKLAGYSILLTDQNGALVRRIAFPYDDEKTAVYPDRLFLGGIMYKKQ